MFVKRFLFGSCSVIRDFTKGHFTDDSNEYKFIYVPASSSSEKNTFSTTAGFLIFSGESLSRSNRSLDKRFDLRFGSSMWQKSASGIPCPCDKLLWLTHFFAFWSFLVVQQNFNIRFQCPCYKPGAHAQYTIRWSMLRLGLRASLGPAIIKVRHKSSILLLPKYSTQTTGTYFAS